MNSVYTKYIIFLLFCGITDFLYTMDLTYITLQFSDQTEKKYLRTTLETSKYFNDMFQCNPTINPTIPIQHITADKFNAIYPLMELDIQKRKDYIKTKYENKTYLDLTDILHTNSILDIPEIEEQLIKLIAQKADLSIKEFIGKPNLTTKHKECLNEIHKICVTDYLYELIYKNMTTVSNTPSITILSETNTTNYSPAKKFKINTHNNKIHITRCSNNKIICTIDASICGHESFLFSDNDNFLLYCKEKNEDNKTIFPVKTFFHGDSERYGYDCILVNLNDNTEQPIKNVIWLNTSKSSRFTDASPETNLHCKFNPTAEYMLIYTYDEQNEEFYDIYDLSLKKSIRNFYKKTPSETIISIEFIATDKLYINKEEADKRSFAIINLKNCSEDITIPFDNTYYTVIKQHNKKNNYYLIHNQINIYSNIENVYLYDAKMHSLKKVELPPSLKKTFSAEFNSKKNSFLLYGENETTFTELFLYQYDQFLTITSELIYTHKVLTMYTPVGCHQYVIDASHKYIIFGEINNSDLSCFCVIDIKTQELNKLYPKGKGSINLHPTQPIVFIHQPLPNDQSNYQLIIYRLDQKKILGIHNTTCNYYSQYHLSQDTKSLLIHTKNSNSITKPNRSIKIINVATNQEIINYDHLGRRQTIYWQGNNLLIKSWRDNNLLIKNKPTPPVEKNPFLLFELCNRCFTLFKNQYPLSVCILIYMIGFFIAAYIIMN